jgi:predicted alpha/beta-fold hydrolase
MVAQVGSSLGGAAVAEFGFPQSARTLVKNACCSRSSARIESTLIHLDARTNNTRLTEEFYCSVSQYGFVHATAVGPSQPEVRRHLC